jgi:hypothetical protein
MRTSAGQVCPKQDSFTNAYQVHDAVETSVGIAWENGLACTVTHVHINSRCTIDKVDG